MTSNGEREFPAPFLRRCVRLTIEPPSEEQLTDIVKAHLKSFLTPDKRAEMNTLIKDFVRARQQQDVSTDQLLNAVFLTIAMRDVDGRTFDKDELKEVRSALNRPLSGAGA
jgi:MoxR-like ATPase